MQEVVSMSGFLLDTVKASLFYQVYQFESTQHKTIGQGHVVDRIHSPRFCREVEVETQVN